MTASEKEKKQSSYGWVFKIKYIKYRYDYQIDITDCKEFITNERKNSNKERPSTQLLCHLLLVVF